MDSTGGLYSQQGTQYHLVWSGTPKHEFRNPFGNCNLKSVQTVAILFCTMRVRLSRCIQLPSPHLCSYRNAFMHNFRYLHFSQELWVWWMCGICIFVMNFNSCHENVLSHKSSSYIYLYLFHMLLLLQEVMCWNRFVSILIKIHSGKVFKAILNFTRIFYLKI